MNTLFVLLLIALTVVIGVLFWKYGFVHDAEKPQDVIDRPVMDAKERRAIKKRLKRWREEGKLSREEYDHFTTLCREEWDDESK